MKQIAMFRAYDKKKGEMVFTSDPRIVVQFNDLYPNGVIVSRIFPHDHEDLECNRADRWIGRYDVEKNPIYEGDIVLPHYEYPDDKVIEIKGLLTFFLNGLEEDKCLIVGNIYENKKLLENKK